MFKGGAIAKPSRKPIEDSKFSKLLSNVYKEISTEMKPKIGKSEDGMNDQLGDMEIVNNGDGTDGGGGTPRRFNSPPIMKRTEGGKVIYDCKMTVKHTIKQGETYHDTSGTGICNNPLNFLFINSIKGSAYERCSFACSPLKVSFDNLQFFSKQSNDTGITGVMCMDGVYLEHIILDGNELGLEDKLSYSLLTPSGYPLTSFPLYTAARSVFNKSYDNLRLTATGVNPYDRDTKSTLRLMVYVNPGYGASPKPGTFSDRFQDAVIHHPKYLADDRTQLLSRLTDSITGRIYTKVELNPLIPQYDGGRNRVWNNGKTEYLSTKSEMPSYEAHPSYYIKGSYGNSGNIDVQQLSFIDESGAFGLPKYPWNCLSYGAENEDPYKLIGVTDPSATARRQLVGYYDAYLGQDHDYKNFNQKGPKTGVRKEHFFALQQLPADFDSTSNIYAMFDITYECSFTVFTQGDYYDGIDTGTIQQENIRYPGQMFITSYIQNKLTAGDTPSFIFSPEIFTSFAYE
uniref:Capsid protein n=1 Tax=Macrobrachium rosenbergii bidensovirus TaxID=2800469 RepID=A0A7T7FQZ4_9VIRU|nr:hypothetical protein [Macrobrachium rosenbergii bidensovirus]